MSRVSKKQADHIVARVSGVSETDTKVQAAEKAIEMMRRVGFPASGIRKAEKMLEQLRKQEGN